ncbi:hypothetical protein J2X36_004274 [Methylobacterium sp. BE186]|nr:hypothetical protein [Methylobacterium sp. BE186]
MAAHGSFPQRDRIRSRWLARYEAFAVASGPTPSRRHGLGRPWKPIFPRSIRTRMKPSCGVAASARSSSSSLPSLGGPGSVERRRRPRSAADQRIHRVMPMDDLAAGSGCKAALCRLERLDGAPRTSLDERPASLAEREEQSPNRGRHGDATGAGAGSRENRKERR